MDRSTSPKSKPTMFKREGRPDSRVPMVAHHSRWSLDCILGASNWLPYMVNCSIVAASCSSQKLQRWLMGRGREARRCRPAFLPFPSLCCLTERVVEAHRQHPLRWTPLPSPAGSRRLLWPASQLLATAGMLGVILAPSNLASTPELWRDSFQQRPGRQGKRACLGALPPAKAVLRVQSPGGIALMLQSRAAAPQKAGRGLVRRRLRKNQWGCSQWWL